MNKLTPLLLLALAPLAVVSCLSRTSAEDPVPGPVLEAGIYASDGGETRTVRVSVLIDRELSETRGWFVEPPKLERWLAEEVELSIEVGAPVSLAWPSYGVTVNGEVVEAEVGSHLELRLDPFAGAPETWLRLSGVDAPGGVRVLIEQWPFPGDARGEEVADAHRRSWIRALRVLASALYRGLPTTPAPPPDTR